MADGERKWVRAVKQLERHGKRLAERDEMQRRYEQQMEEEKFSRSRKLQHRETCVALLEEENPIGDCPRLSKKQQRRRRRMLAIWRKTTIESTEENSAGRHVTNSLGTKRNSWLM